MPLSILLTFFCVFMFPPPSPPPLPPGVRAIARIVEISSEIRGGRKKEGLGGGGGLAGGVVFFCCLVSALGVRVRYR